LQRAAFSEMVKGADIPLTSDQTQFEFWSHGETAARS